jgi:mannose-6-phosphate isomerase-like protein (cupin superfamily)
MSTHIIRSADAPRFSLPGVEFTGLASPSRGSSQICTWTIAVEAGHDSPEPHTIDRDEIFLVTAGALRLQPDANLLRAGDAAVVPAGTPIQVSNPGPEIARAVVSIAAAFSAQAADGSAIGTPPWAR